VDEGDLPGRRNHDDADQVEDIETSQAGFVYIRLESTSNSARTFTITVREQLTFPQLLIGEPLANQSISAGQILWYQMPVQRGQQLHVFLDKATPFYSYLSVDEGDLPGRRNHDDADQVEDIETSQAGLVYIRLESTSNSTRTFTITVREQLTFPQLLIGEPLANQSISAGQILWYQVPVQRAQQLYVFLDKATPFYSYLSVDEGDLPGRRNHDDADQVEDIETSQAGLVYIRLESTSNSTRTFTITIRGTTLSPSFGVVSAKSTSSGEALTFLVSATDPDGDPLTYEETTLPPGAVFDPDAQRFTWTPNATQVGSHAATFRVADGQGGSDTLTVSITVTDGNHPPAFATVSAKSGNEGERLTFTVSATDADGDPLTYAETSLPSGAAFSLATRRFTWTPDFTQAGTHTVTFRVSDGKAEDTLTVNTTIRNVNRPPVFVAADAQTVGEGEVLAFTVSGADPDADDALTYAAGSLPAGATFTASTRELRWTPAFDQTGSYSVEFTVTDGEGLSDSLVVAVTVGEVNRPPSIIAIGAKTVAEKATLVFEVIATDADAGSDLDYTATSLPSGATFASDTHVFRWTPTHGQSGSHTAAFEVTDGSLRSSITVQIDVTDVGRSPSFSAAADQVVDEGNVITFRVLASDPDPGDTLTYSALALPDDATFNEGTRTFRWEPTYNQAGPYSLDFQVVDSTGLTNSLTVGITVQNTNRPPTLTPVNAGPILEGQTLGFVVEAEDLDTDDTLTFAAPVLPDGATFDPATQRFRWTPGFDQQGDHAIEFGVDDGSGGDDTLIVPIVVENSNRLPTFVDLGDHAIAESSELTFTVIASDADLENVAMELVGSVPDGATFDAASGEFRWTPTPQQAGDYVVEFAAADTEGGRVAQAITITVTDFNRIPAFAVGPPEQINTAEGSSVLLTVEGTDPDGDVLELTATGLPDEAVFDGVTGEFSFTPDFTQAGIYVVVFQLDDGAAVAQASTTIVVADTELLTLSPAQDWQIAEGKPLSLNVILLPLADIVITVDVRNAPDGSTYDASSGEFTFEPDFTQAGEYEIAFAAVVDGEDVEVKSVHVVVDEASILAIAGSNSITVAEGEQASAQVQRTDQTDFDITVSMNAALEGATYDPETGEFTLTPWFDQAGTYEVKFIATQAGETVSEQTLFIEVQDTPVLEILPGVALTATEGETLSVDVTVGDRVSIPVALAAMTRPENATFDASAGAFQFDPDFTQSGSYTVTFVASSTEGREMDRQTINVSVVAANVLSISPSANITMSEGEVVDVGLDVLADAHGEVGLILVGEPNFASLDAASNTLTLRPDFSDAGSFDLRVRAMQGGSIAEEEQVSILVRDVNVPPSIALDPPRMDGDDVSIAYRINDLDGDRVSLTVEYSKDSGPWRDASLDRAVTNTNTYSGTLVWHSRDDIPSSGGVDVEVRVTPRDAQDGVSATTLPIEVVNLLGDYDENMAVGFDDLSLFTQAWRENDSNRDIGPTTGTAPDLVPLFDGVVDFEDLMTFVVMWNWSSENAPPAAPGLASPGAARSPVRYEATVDRSDWRRQTLGFALDDPSNLLAARITLQYDPQELNVSAAEPIVGREGRVFLDRHDEASGLLDIQTAWLTEDALADTLASIQVESLRQGDASLRVTFDIRDRFNRPRRGQDVFRFHFEPRPASTALLQNYPNPFNPETWIPFELSEDSDVVVTVYDLEGALIRTLLLGEKTVGRYRSRDRAAYWDGANEQGEPASSGVYVYELRAGGYREMRRMVIRK